MNLFQTSCISCTFPMSVFDRAFDTSRALAILSSSAYKWIAKMWIRDKCRRTGWKIWKSDAILLLEGKCISLGSKPGMEPEQGHHVMFLRKTPIFSCLHLPPSPRKKNCTGWPYWLYKFNISPVCPNQVPGVNTGNPVMFWQNHPSQYCDQESLHQHSLPIHKAVSEKEQCQPWTYDRRNNYKIFKTFPILS